MTPEEHFSAGRLLQQGYPEDLSLAAWHFQQAVSYAPAGSDLSSAASIELRQAYLSHFRGDLTGNTEGVQGNPSLRRDLEEQLRMLRQRNRELESWISRLNTENLSLRQALLKSQEQGQ